MFCQGLIFLGFIPNPLWQKSLRRDAYKETHEKYLDELELILANMEFTE